MKKTLIAGLCLGGAGFHYGAYLARCGGAGGAETSACGAPEAAA